MTGGGGGGERYLPQVRLTRNELRQYDASVAMVLDEAVSEFSNFNGYIDTNDWSLVRRCKQMSVYRSLQPSDDPRVTLMVGTGLIPGTLEDVMGGVYCDTTADLRAVKTFLKYKFLDGAVLNVTEKRTIEAPFDFAGVKWFAAKAPWGIIKHRDLLTYEVHSVVYDYDLSIYLIASCCMICPSAWARRWTRTATSSRFTCCSRLTAPSGPLGS